MTTKTAIPRLLSLIVAWGVVTQATPLLAEDAKPVPAASTGALSEDQKKKNVESFDMVWTTVRDTHFDPTLNGIDWNAVREEIRPQVEKAATTEEAWALIMKALAKLGQSHFGLIPAEAYRSLENSKSGDGEVGIVVRVVDGRAVVVSVVENSSAAKAGVRPGWVVEQVGDKTTLAIFEAVEKAFPRSPMQSSYKALGVMSRLSGEIGKTVSVKFLDAQDRPVALDLRLQESDGVVAKFGNLPDFHVKFVAKKIEETIEYVSLNIFFDPVRVLDLFARAIETSQQAEGVIIDLRGNPGGIGAMSIAMGGWLVAGDDHKLGTMTTRTNALHFTLNPRTGAYEGPVAILVDELSMSTSEILAGGLQDMKRARIFGTKTPGAALPSRFEVLPNGDRFQHAFANYTSAGGKTLEGNGVTPDVEVPLSRPVLIEGRDPVIEAAAKWIHSEKSKP